MSYIHFPNEIGTPETLGGKAFALASLRAENLRVPEWFVVTPKAFWASLNAVSKEALTFATCAQEMQQAIAKIYLHASVREELAGAIKNIFPNTENFAVRSSAIDEDGLSHSFAGQLDSFLFVSQAELADKIIAVWRSAFSQRLFAYRAENDLPLYPQPPAVIVQAMINADVAGVAFGADPVSGQRGSLVISAVHGVGDQLVSGAIDGVTHIVNRNGEIVNTSVHSILSDNQIKKIAALVKVCNLHFGRPQDIEWAIENGELFLLQSRPITTLKNLADPDGALNLWDNSNIAESYGGITTPLTFSFARRAYEEVYRQFCRLMLVPPATLKHHDQTFKNMLGLMEGRMYYNLLNWYRVLTILPGFKINRQFMEQMMGVKEGLPASLLDELSQARTREKLRDALNLLVTSGGLMANYFLLARRTKEFYGRLDDALQETNLPLSEMRADELAAYYRKIEAQLLTRWDAPLVNDFFAMIFYGTLRRLCEKWCGDKGGSLQNNLLCGEGGIVSAEPAQQIRAMAALITDESDFDESDFIDVLCNNSLLEINRQLTDFPQLQAQIKNYLAKFGDRCLDELKLESATLHDDPLLLFRSIGQVAKSLRVGQAAMNQAASASRLRAAADAQIKAALTRHPLQKLIFNWVLRQTRNRVRERENLRFERTRLFGRARRLFIELGKRFYADDLLNEPRDIFYLEVEEVLGFTAGTTTTTNLKSLVALRQCEFMKHRQAAAPPDRFATYGAPHQGNQFQAMKSGSVATIGDTRKGLACCPGIVCGNVRVITDPRNAVLQRGEILVAERTDPGWIILFPAAAGLLVERGSLLSHSAIVAREMGLPAIVSMAGVMQWLRDGDEIEMDGSTGMVTKISVANTTENSATNEHRFTQISA